MNQRSEARAVGQELILPLPTAWLRRTLHRTWLQADQRGPPDDQPLIVTEAEANQEAAASTLNWSNSWSYTTKQTYYHSRCNRQPFLQSMHGARRNNCPCYHGMSWSGNIPGEISRIAEVTSRSRQQRKGKAFFRMNNDFISMNNDDPPRKIGASDVKLPKPRPRVQSIKND